MRAQVIFTQFGILWLKGDTTLKRSILYATIAIASVLIIVVAGVVLISGLLNNESIPSGGNFCETFNQ